MSPLHSIMLPAKTDPRWTALVTSGPSQPPKLLALRLMLTRMKLQIRRDPAPANIAKIVDELYGFFVKDPRRVEDDSATLFG